ncbi:MAG: hypothetical protein KC619_17335, partial [Myxococcales bacterium]|nr:hypothetical protein [Myxococcales bacterium]
WDAMEPRDGGRYCGRCEKVVIDLAALSRAQAEQKIRSLDASEVCVQLAVDRFGDAVFQRPPPSRAPHWAAGVVLLTALTGATACDEPEPPCHAKAFQLEPDPGPPMMPAETSLASVAPLPTTGPVPAEELTETPAIEATPTAEQQALTAAKHRPPVVHVRGRMPIHHPPAPLIF